MHSVSFSTNITHCSLLALTGNKLLFFFNLSFKWTLIALSNEQRKLTVYEHWFHINLSLCNLVCLKWFFLEKWSIYGTRGAFWPYHNHKRSKKHIFQGYYSKVIVKILELGNLGGKWTFDGGVLVSKSIPLLINVSPYCQYLSWLSICFISVLLTPIF